ncbi:MAG: SRPBCC family protein [bacterium]
MSWQREYTTIVPGITREEVWNAWQDVNNWHRWDTDLDYARLDGPFATGSRFTLKPKGGPRVQIEFERVEPLNAYVDLTHFPLARMWGIHEMHDTSDGLALRCCIRIEGPLSFLWRKIVAEGVVNGLEKQTRQLVAYIHARREHAIAPDRQEARA